MTGFGLVCVQRKGISDFGNGDVVVGHARGIASMFIISSVQGG